MSKAVCDLGLPFLGVVKIMEGTTYEESANQQNRIVGCREDFSRGVWAHNLYEEFFEMLKVAEKYNYIAMDTEYPGTVVNIMGPSSGMNEQYTSIAANINLLKLIQLGFSFFDEDGNEADNPNTWEFNFKFSPALDMGAQESLDLLYDSGFNFYKHDTEGIDHMAFAELLFCSNLIANPNIRWIAFHGISDFCYLVKMLANTNLPHQESKFYPLLNTYFPRIYDVKYMTKDCRKCPGGLQNLAVFLEIQRSGTAHHAGSDSLATGRVFFKLLTRFFDNEISDVKYCGQLYGCGHNDPMPYIRKHPGHGKSPDSYFVKKNK